MIVNPPKKIITKKNLVIISIGLSLIIEIRWRHSLFATLNKKNTILSLFFRMSCNKTLEQLNIIKSSQNNLLLTFFNNFLFFFRLIFRTIHVVVEQLHNLAFSSGEDESINWHHFHELFSHFLLCCSHLFGSGKSTHLTAC